MQNLTTVIFSNTKELVSSVQPSSTRP